MDDRPLVRALVAGDPRGLADAYRGYADQLYTYCRAMLGDPAAAADPVHDTFVLASQRIGELREPERLRSWLYAIARNECLRRLRGRPRQVSLAEAGEVTAPEPDPAGLRAGAIQELVWSAAQRLDPGDREVFELAVRHGLPAPEIAAVLGVPAANADARLSRARAQLEHALGAEVVSGYGSVPSLAAPAELWPRLELKCFDPGLELERAAILRRAGRFDKRSGFPVPLDVARRRRRALAATATAMVAVLAVAGASALTWTTGTDAGESPSGPPSRPALAAPAPPPPPPASPSAAPSLAPTPSPTGSPSPSPPATSPPPAPATTGPVTDPDPLAVSATGGVDCGLLACWVEATATANKPIESAELLVAAGSAQPQSYPMDVDGTTASGSGPLRSPDSQWWVIVTAGDERAESAAVPVSGG